MDCDIMRYQNGSIRMIEDENLLAIFGNIIEPCVLDEVLIERWTAIGWYCDEGCLIPTLFVYVLHEIRRGDGWIIANIEGGEYQWECTFWAPIIMSTCWEDDDTGLNMLESVDFKLLADAGFKSRLTTTAPPCPGIMNLSCVAGFGQCSCPEGFVMNSSMVSCCEGVYEYPGRMVDGPLEDCGSDDYVYEIILNEWTTDVPTWGTLTLGFSRTPDTFIFNKYGQEPIANGSRNYFYFDNLIGNEIEWPMSSTYQIYEEPRYYAERYITVVVTCGGSEILRYRINGPSLVIPDELPPPPDPEEQCREYVAVVGIGFKTRVGPFEINIRTVLATSEPYCDTPPPGWVQELIDSSILPNEISMGPISYSIEEVGFCPCPAS